MEEIINKYLDLIKENEALRLVMDELLNHKKLGFTPETDAKYTKGQLLMFGHYCLLSNEANIPKGEWPLDYLKQIHKKTKLEQMTIGTSLVIAEMNRRIKAGIDCLNDKCKDCLLYLLCTEEEIKLNCKLIQDAIKNEKLEEDE